MRVEYTPMWNKGSWNWKDKEMLGNYGNRTFLIVNQETMNYIYI